MIDRTGGRAVEISEGKQTVLHALTSALRWYCSVGCFCLLLSLILPFVMVMHQGTDVFFATYWTERCLQT